MTTSSHLPPDCVAPVTLDVPSLRTLTDHGFTGGHDSFRRFCASLFERDEPRFLRSGDNDLVVFRQADLRALGSMPELANVPPAVLFPGFGGQSASGEPPPGAGIAAVISNQVFTANPPIHGPIRRILVNQLSPKAVAGMDDLARHTVRCIVAEFPPAGEIEFVADVAEKLTARFWGRLLGMTDAEVTAIAIYARALTPLFFIERSMDDLHRVDAAIAQYGAIVEHAALRSLSQGDHPFVAAMAEELAQVDLPDDPGYAGVVPKNVGALLAGNLVDGFHTAALAAANTVFALLHHPQALASVTSSPDLLRNAIMEALRLEPPVIFLKRFLFTDVVYDGLLLPQGTSVAMMWGAGNLDPKVFPEPERFDLGRSHQGLTTFGGGLHICPGRHVAVMLVRAMLQVATETGLQFELIDAPGDWLGNHSMNQLGRMPLRIRRRC